MQPFWTPGPSGVFLSDLSTPSSGNPSSHRLPLEVSYRALVRAVISASGSLLRKVGLSASSVSPSSVGGIGLPRNLRRLVDVQCVPLSLGRRGPCRPLLPSMRAEGLVLCIGSDLLSIPRSTPQGLQFLILLIPRSLEEVLQTPASR